MEPLEKLRTFRATRAIIAVEKALQSRTDITPAVRQRMEDVISRSRHVGTGTDKTILADLAREVEQRNVLFTGRPGSAGTISVRGGTMSPMEERARMQQQAASMRQRLGDPSTPAREKNAIIAQLPQLEAQMARLPTGQVELNLYAWRHKRDDLNTWYNGLKGPSAQQTEDYQAVQARLNAYIGEAERRFKERVRDASNSVLAQAGLGREQVQRELLSAVEKDKGVSRADFEKYTQTWQRWTRSGVRLVGSTVGAISGVGLSSTAGTALGLTGALAAYPVLAGTALVAGTMYAGGVAGAALSRYVPWLVPFGPLSRKAARSLEAKVRTRKMLDRDATYAELEKTLRDNVAEESTRVHEMGRLLQAEYGNIGTRTARGVGKVMADGLRGTAIAGAIGAGMTIYKSPAAFTQWPPTLDTGKTLVTGSVANLTHVFNAYISPWALWLLKPAARLLRYKLFKH